MNSHELAPRFGLATSRDLKLDLENIPVWSSSQPLGRSRERRQCDNEIGRGAGEAIADYSQREILSVLVHLPVVAHGEMTGHGVLAELVSLRFKEPSIQATNGFFVSYGT